MLVVLINQKPNITKTGIKHDKAGDEISSKISSYLVVGQMKCL